MLDWRPNMYHDFAFDSRGYCMRNGSDDPASFICYGHDNLLSYPLSLIPGDHDVNCEDPEDLALDDNDLASNPFDMPDCDYQAYSGSPAHDSIQSSPAPSVRSDPREHLQTEERYWRCTSAPAMSFGFASQAASSTAIRDVHLPMAASPDSSTISGDDPWQIQDDHALWTTFGAFSPNMRLPEDAVDKQNRTSPETCIETAGTRTGPSREQTLRNKRVMGIQARRKRHPGRRIQVDQTPEIMARNAARRARYRASLGEKQRRAYDASNPGMMTIY